MTCGSRGDERYYSEDMLIQKYKKRAVDSYRKFTRK